MPKALFIGLGAMGRPMADNLAAAGFLHSVWNRSHDRALEAASKLGVLTAPSLEPACSGADTVFMCVRADEDVVAVAGQLAECLARNSLVIDCSTVSVQTARHVASMLAAKGIHFLDAPVTGGVEGARLAKLVFMVGGHQKHLETVRPMLATMGERIVHMGGTGMGQATKAVNQVMCAGINQAVTEALAFGETLDLDMTKVIQVISGGAAGNWFMDKRGLTMLAGQYSTGFKLALHLKDLKICRQMAEFSEISLPLTQRTIEDYECLISQGFGDEDISALFRLRTSSQKDS